MTLFTSSSMLKAAKRGSAAIVKKSNKFEESKASEILLDDAIYDV